jgi:hypothetical protein
LSEPVSWLVVERGWKVVAADGQELGTVEETVGDSTHDIFSGLTVAGGALQRPRFVPAEVVDEIVEDGVRLSIGPDEFEQLEPYEEPPPSAQIRPE